MLRYVFQILVGSKLLPLSASRSYYAQRAIIEVDSILTVHHSHVVGAMGVGVGENQIDIAGVLEHNVVEQRKCELSEIDSLGRDFLELLLCFRCYVLSHSPWQTEHGMRSLPASQRHQLSQAPPHGNHFLARLNPNFRDDSQHIPLSSRGVRPHHKIGAAQEIEMKRVVLSNKGAVDQLANLLGRRWRFDLINVVESFGRCHVVSGRTYAADTRSNLRHLFDRTSLHELLKPAQFGHLEEGSFDRSRVVQENVDLAMSFKTSYGIDGDTAAHEDCACVRNSFLTGTGWCWLVLVGHKPPHRDGNGACRTPSGLFRCNNDPGRP